MISERDALAEVLLQCRAIIDSGRRPARADECGLIDELIRHLEADEVAGFAPERLAQLLEGVVGPDEERRALLVDIIGMAARSAATTQEKPREQASVVGPPAWRTLLAVVDKVHGSGVHSLGRLPFITDQLLALLVEEAGEKLGGPAGSTHRVGPAGPVLAKLAVSRKLREALSSAFGFPVVSTYSAVYLYDKPGSEMAPHVDARDHELEFHLILEHSLPRNGFRGSALLAHLSGRPHPVRMELAPGESVALRARGTIHTWEPLQEDESRTLVGIGFKPAS